MIICLRWSRRQIKTDPSAITELNVHTYKKCHVIGIVEYGYCASITLHSC